MSTVKVKLVRSTAGRLKKHKLIIKSLGLRKLNQVKELKDCPEIRGQIKKVEYMLRIVD